LIRPLPSREGNVRWEPTETISQEIGSLLYLRKGDGLNGVCTQSEWRTLDANQAVWQGAGGSSTAKDFAGWQGKTAGFPPPSEERGVQPGLFMKQVVKFHVGQPKSKETVGFFL
jgi:hypothetical protein